jgi:hypothetical protein
MEEKSIIQLIKEQAKNSKNAYEWMESLPGDVEWSILERADAVKRALEWAESLPDADQNDNEGYTH